MKDFYVILPSNACPDKHPENEANKYNISWETPINLDQSKWQVALTEANFNYTMSTTNTNFGIEYDIMSRMEADYKCSVRVSTFLKEVSFRDFFPTFPYIATRPTYDDWEPPKAYFNNDYTISIDSKHKFSISFAQRENAQHFGFAYTFRVESKPVTQEDGYVINRVTTQTSLNPKRVEDDKEIPAADFVLDHVQFHFLSRPYRDTYKIYVSSEHYWNNPNDMVKALSKEFGVVFNSMTYTNNKRIQISLRPLIFKVTFLNGLNIVLGFNKKTYENLLEIDKTDGRPISAEFAPYLRHGINNLYIYASICQPIRVGGVSAPLLKTLWLDVNKRAYTFGETHNTVIKNPMYIPISTSSINTIEVNIRSDSGRLVPFIEGSITSLTLHFREI